MNKKLAAQIRDKLAVEAHEIVHLIMQINDRLQTMTEILEPKPDPIDMSKWAVVQAIWEQNADRTREEVEIEVVKVMNVDPVDMQGTPTLKDWDDTEECGMPAEQDMNPTYQRNGRPFTEEELTGNIDNFTTGVAPGDMHPIVDHVSTDYQHWEQLYYQSQANSTLLLERNEELTLKLKAVNDMLTDYTGD